MSCLPHPVYGKEGGPQNLKAREMKEDARDFVRIMKAVQPKQREDGWLKQSVGRTR